MSEKKKAKQAEPETNPDAIPDSAVAEEETVSDIPQAIPEAEVIDPLQAELEVLKNKVAEQEEKYLRLAAEYDNFRKRSQKEKETAWTDAKADTAAAFLPVYDNLQRALKQETADEAYAKGVEMTMTQLQEILKQLSVEAIEAEGQPFDPSLHNAVMHIDDESFGENTVAEVFQQGFQCSGKVIRFAMVKVAN